jgi:hypothetical protein
MAREDLRQREETSLQRIGFWTATRMGDFEHADTIAEWAVTKGLDCVVWTALEPTYPDHNGRVLTCDEVVKFLGGLKGTDQQRAQEYIRRTPHQITTGYRPEIEGHLRWPYDGSKTDHEIIAQD